MKRLFYAFIIQSLFTAAAFAWVYNAVMIRGELQSVNEKYIVLKTPNRSVIRIPKRDSDNIFYGKPLALKRSLNDLSQFQLVKAAPGLQKGTLSVKTPDYKAIAEEARELLSRSQKLQSK
jgi:hypothetical protein